VVLDPEMAGVDGWAVLREIRADPRLEELAVVVFAGPAGACDAEGDPHVRAVLSKPVFLDAFLAAVRQFHRSKLPKGY
jgi:CheY-like chemotaxis protein